jgi:hypothetical protein
MVLQNASTLWELFTRATKLAHISGVSIILPRSLHYVTRDSAYFLLHYHSTYNKYRTLLSCNFQAQQSRWVFLFWTWQKQLWRLENAGKCLFRMYQRDWYEPITLKLNIYHFEPPNFGRPPKQLAKNAEKCAINSFFIAEDDPTNLDNFHKPFGKYITSKSTFSHPNIEYLSSHLCLRKFWQCRNSTFRTIQRDLHEPIRLKLNIYIVWPPKFGWPPNN